MRPADLRIATTVEGSTATVTAVGEIDLATIEALVAAVQDVLEEDDVAGGELALDLRDIAFIDSAGVAGINACRRHAIQAGTRLSVLVRQGGEVARLLDWTGLDRVVDVRVL